MEPTEEIRKRTEGCQSLFAKCLSNPHFLDKDWLENRQAEFNLWVASLKAASIGRSSLDYRVRDHLETRELICDLLDGLSESLGGLLQIVEPSSLISMLETEKELLLLPEDDAGSIFSSFSTDEGDTDSLPSIGKANGPLSEHMFNTKTIIGELAKLSKAIRQSGAKFRFGKADASLKETDFEDFKTDLTIAILLGKVVADTGESDNATTIGLRLMSAKPLTKIQNRLVRANVVRRNRIVFATRSMRRVEKQAAQQRSVIHKGLPARTDGPMTIISDNPTKQVPNMPIVASQAPSIKTSYFAPTATEIGSQFSLQHTVQPKKSTPSVITRATRIGAEQDYPNCPKPISDKILQCPYCADMLSATCSKNRSSWRGHVARDLLPYICIYDDCETSDNMYLTADDLSKHMCSRHGVNHWVCDYCASKSESGYSFVFESSTDWEYHMKMNHVAVSASQLPSLAKVSQRRMLEALTCPLCEYAAEYPQSSLDDHIAKHLHEFALRCLPWGTGDEDGDSVNARTLITSDSSEVNDTGSEDEELCQPDLTEVDSPLRIDQTLRDFYSRLAGVSGHQSLGTWPYGVEIEELLRSVRRRLSKHLSVAENSSKAQADQLTRQQSHRLPLADLFPAESTSPRKQYRIDGRLQSFNLDLTPGFPEPESRLLEIERSQLLKITHILRQALLRWGLKRPSDSFELYCQKTRPTLMSKAEDQSININEELARGWADLPDDQRKYFMEESEYDKKDYEDYMTQITQDTKLMLQDELRVLKFALSDNHLVRSTDPQTSAPTTLRVLLPISISKQELTRQLSSMVSRSSSIEIRSFARFCQTLWCATFLAYERLKPNPRDSYLKVQEDFIGIVPLWDPPPGRVAVDIVSISGPGTRAEMAYRTKARNGVVSSDNWLRDYMHHRVGNARVLLYGYKSRVPKRDSTATTTQMAYALIHELIWIRKETNTQYRPILLLGHSLGGILIKEMIQYLFYSNVWTRRGSALASSCKGFIFFGVPNGGLSAEALGNLACDEPTHYRIEDLLCENGQLPRYLTSMHEDFRKALSKLPRFPEISVFYETKFSPIKQLDPKTGTWILTGSEIMMVEQSSANLHNLKCRSQPLDTNHSDLIRFTGRTDPNYVTVIDEIQEMVSRLSRYEVASKRRQAVWSLVRPYIFGRYTPTAEFDDW